MEGLGAPESSEPLLETFLNLIRGFKKKSHRNHGPGIDINAVNSDLETPLEVLRNVLQNDQKLETNKKTICL